jgi:hypothetical protein
VPNVDDRTVMTSKSAEGNIGSLTANWINPLGVDPYIRSNTLTGALVEDTRVFAQNFHIKGITCRNGDKVALGDLGMPPFQIILPLYDIFN